MEDNGGNSEGSNADQVGDESKDEEDSPTEEEMMANKNEKECTE